MFSADLGVNQVASNPPATDPPFQKVALLLHGDGTNGAQNNTFVDSSTNNFTITRTGNVAQGTFSPFSLADGQWSNYIPSASATCLKAGTSTSLALGSGDFTVETWVYINALAPSYTNLFDWRTNGSTPANIPWVGDWNNNGKIAFQSTVGTTVVESNTVIPLKQWVHFAVVRSGSTVTMYFNGSSVGSGTSSANLGIETLNIGSPQTVSNYNPDAYFSNVRIVKGTAVYTSNFTTPTSALTAITNTSLLTCQSNRFKDNSSNNFTITPAGNTKVTAFSPFAPSAAYSASTNGGSGYFNGTIGNYISAPDSTGFQFGSSDFTIEGWIYLNSLTATSFLMGKGDRATAAGSAFSMALTTYQMTFYSGSSAYSLASYTAPLRTWFYLAIVRNGTTITRYINGVSNSSVAIGTASINTGGTNEVRIGGYVNASGFLGIDGYISNLRIVKGTAVYTANFTPPTAPLTAITNTQLLLNCTNAGIYDNAGKNDIETVGNAQISTSVKKYGTGSMYFDGTGDWLVIPASTELTLNADFTIEFWVNLAATTDMMALSNSGGTQQLFRFNYSTANTVSVYVGAFWFNQKSSVPSGTWTHVALTRSGSTAYLFIDGVSKGTYTGTGVSTTLNIERVGVFGSGGTYPFNGYIDDLRITKGQALYTSNFTPPTQAFPNV